MYYIDYIRMPPSNAPPSPRAVRTLYLFTATVQRLKRRNTRGSRLSKVFSEDLAGAAAAGPWLLRRVSRAPRPRRAASRRPDRASPRACGIWCRPSHTSDCPIASAWSLAHAAWPWVVGLHHSPAELREAFTCERATPTVYFQP